MIITWSCSFSFSVTAGYFQKLLYIHSNMHSQFSCSCCCGARKGKSKKLFKCGVVIIIDHNDRICSTMCDVIMRKLHYHVNVRGRQCQYKSRYRMLFENLPHGVELVLTLQRRPSPCLYHIENHHFIIQILHQY